MDMTRQEFKKTYDAMEHMPEAGQEENLFRTNVRARLDPFTREHEFQTKVVKPLLDLRDVLNDPATGINRVEFYKEVLKGNIDKHLAPGLRAKLVKGARSKDTKWSLKDLDYLTPAVTRELRKRAPLPITGAEGVDAARISQDAGRYGLTRLALREGVPFLAGAAKGYIGGVGDQLRYGAGASPVVSRSLFGGESPFDPMNYHGTGGSDEYAQDVLFDTTDSTKRNK
jgi:hypothetical protein